jgi:hypothetical protein
MHHQKPLRYVLPGPTSGLPTTIEALAMYETVQTGLMLTQFFGNLHRL